VRAFRQLEEEHNPPWEHYNDIILKDPGLVLHALRELQGGGKSSRRRPEIASISQLGMLLGMERVKQLPYHLPQMERSLRGMARQGFARAASRAFHAAFQAWDWAHITKDHAPHEILLATLLHDVAELTLWIMAPEKMHEHRRLMLRDGVPTDEAQYLAFGESLDHFGRQLAVNWGLPPLVHEALRPEQASNARVQGIMLAVQLARAADRGWYWEKVERVMPQIAEHLGGTLEETTAHVHMNAVRAAREADFYGARPVAALLPLLPGGEEALIQDEFPGKPASPRTSSASGVETIPSSRSGNSGGVCLMPQPPIFKKTVMEIRAKLGQLELSEVMRKVIHGMHHGAALNRVVFAAMTPNGKMLQARFMTGSDNDPEFNRFEISLDKPHLFTRLMEKPQSLWINDDNREKFWRLVPQGFKDRIQTDCFFVMSMHANGKPIGLFYADRHRADCQLDKACYEQFRTLCQMAVKGYKGPV
jgi:HD-like signal output (HDOD) protein